MCKRNGIAVRKPFGVNKCGIQFWSIRRTMSYYLLNMNQSIIEEYTKFRSSKLKKENFQHKLDIKTET